MTIAEPSSRDLVQRVGEGGTLLLDGDGVVSVLVSEVFHLRSQMPKEDYTKPSDYYPTREYRRNDSQTFSSPISSPISMFAPSTVPTNNPPFKQNFIFEVPLASVPAVEICWEMLLAGTNNSATDTE